MAALAYISWMSVDTIDFLEKPSPAELVVLRLLGRIRFTVCALHWDVNGTLCVKFISGVGPRCTYKRGL